ncbi:MAG: DUF4175 domain-containing protein [Chloroflexi bacterium]|nr:DUF4175 domain-containing protein [Chloroflexota bacterium]
MNALWYLLWIVFLLGMGLLGQSLLQRAARVGLGAALFLALVVDGVWLLAPVLDWSADLNTAVGLLVFALFAGSAALDPGWSTVAPGEQTITRRWPSVRDGVFLLLVIAGFGAVVLVLPVPLDTDAQGFGYLALQLRESGDHTSLAPWHPEIDYLYSPAFPGLVAHLSVVSGLGIHVVQMIVGAGAAVLFVWLAYDLGNELDGPRMGRAFMLAALGGTGLLTAFMDSHYTAVLALTFSLAFLTFVLRYLADRRGTDAVFAAICLAAVPLSQPDTTLALMIGYGPWLVVLWWARPRPSWQAWLVLTVAIPATALLIVTPWLFSIRDLLNSSIESPFEVELSHLGTMVAMHGGVVALLAVGGMVLALRQRHPAQLLAVVWLAGIVEFAALGLLERTIPTLVEPLLKYDYPFSLAWHGPIIPYTILGGTALVWLADRWGSGRLDRWLHRLALPGMGLLAVTLMVCVIGFDILLKLSKEYVTFYGAFSSEADVDAMLWLRDHAPDDARILNHPGPHEGDWVPVITERDTVFFRPQPFFRHTEYSEAEQDALRAFWLNPTDPANAERLRAAGVDYVLVPQVFGDPESYDDMIRWQRPLPEARSYAAAPISEEIPFLRLVYEKDGAQVYWVLHAMTPPGE